MRIPRRVCAVALVATATSLLPAQNKDSIALNDGSRLRGVEVTEATVNGVVYKEGSKEGKVPADKVATIEWGNAPSEFAEAKSADDQGRFGAAYPKYLSVGGDDSVRAPLRQEAMFLGARAALRSADDAAKAAGAGEYLQAYLTAAPEGLHMPEARILLGRSLRLQGKNEEAVKYLETFENEALGAIWGMGWGARAKFERAQALIDLGRASDARSAYQSVSSAVDAAAGRGAVDPDLLALKPLALVGEGETYIAEKNFDQALRYFRRHTGSSEKSAAVRAAALAGEGQALFLKAPEDANGLRQAQMSLAQAYILDPNSEQSTAKALYFTGKVLLALGPDKEKDCTARAASYFETVANSYATTSWATKARTEIQK